MAEGNAEHRSAFHALLRRLVPFARAVAATLLVPAGVVRAAGVHPRAAQSQLRLVPGEVICKVACKDGEALVEVIDHRLGFSAADLPRIVTRFGQLITLEKGHINGAGLGFDLSRQLARQLGGDIVVQWREGEGSRFTLRVPAEISG